jgi:hypothetical protein
VTTTDAVPTLRESSVGSEPAGSELPAISPGLAFKFLFGSRAATLALAQSRWTLLIGLLLVLSGTLARAYDTAYLIGEWPILTHGILVSLGNSFILYTLIYGAAKLAKGSLPRFWSGYLSFLGLFWMTAPMAWLYAIPYERFMTPAEAVHANLWTLAFVSAWRVILITRVLSVIFGASPVRTFLIVMLFADVAMFAAAVLMPKPVMDVMGGLQQTEVERAIIGSTFLIIIATVYTFLVWLIGAFIAATGFKSSWAVPSPTRGPVPRACIALAAATLLAWVPALAIAQPEQRLRFRAETMLRTGHVTEAFAEMSAHQRSDYPPVWDPPPRKGYGETEPPMQAIREAILAQPLAAWVEAVFMDKSWRSLVEYDWSWPSSPRGLSDWGKYRGPSPGMDIDGIRFHLEHDARLTDHDRSVLRGVLDEAIANEKP